MLIPIAALSALCIFAAGWLIGHSRGASRMEASWKAFHNSWTKAVETQILSAARNRTGAFGPGDSK
jgi:hypothetical protein